MLPLSTLSPLSVLLLPLLMHTLAQMVLDEFMSVQQMQLGYMWNSEGAWRAFRDVVDQGLIAFTASRWAWMDAGVGVSCSC